MNMLGHAFNIAPSLKNLLPHFDLSMVCFNPVQNQLTSWWWLKYIDIASISLCLSLLKGYYQASISKCLNCYFMPILSFLYRFVNDVKLGPNESRVLKDNDVISFGGASKVKQMNSLEEEFNPFLYKWDVLLFLAFLHCQSAPLRSNLPTFESNWWNWLCHLNQKSRQILYRKYGKNYGGERYQ